MPWICVDHSFIPISHWFRQRYICRRCDKIVKPHEYVAYENKRLNKIFNTPKKNGVIKFSDYEDKILEALRQKKEHLGITEGCTLIHGFVYVPLYESLTLDHLPNSSSALPMVTMVGKKSTKVYFVALKLLLAGIEL